MQVLQSKGEIEVISTVFDFDWNNQALTASFPAQSPDKLSWLIASDSLRAPVDEADSRKLFLLPCIQPIVSHVIFPRRSQNQALIVLDSVLFPTSLKPE